MNVIGVFPAWSGRTGCVNWAIVLALRMTVGESLNTMFPIDMSTHFI